jgi:hypothetical protein
LDVIPGVAKKDWFSYKFHQKAFVKTKAFFVPTTLVYFSDAQYYFYEN